MNYKFDEKEIDKNGTLNGTLKESLSGIVSNINEECLIALIKNNKNITRKELAKKLNVSVRTIQRIINKNDKIEYVGVGKSGYWKIK